MFAARTCKKTYVVFIVINDGDNGARPFNCTSNCFKILLFLRKNTFWVNAKNNPISLRTFSVAVFYGKI